MFNPFSTDASNYVDIINKYIFSLFKFKVIYGVQLYISKRMVKRKMDYFKTKIQKEGKDKRKVTARRETGIETSEKY